MKDKLWRLNSVQVQGVVYLGMFKFPDIEGKNITITGSNASGKSLLLEFIGIALNPKAITRRTQIIDDDQKEATIKVGLIRGNDRLEVERTFHRVDGQEKIKGQPKVKLNGKAVNKPANFLSGLVHAHSLNLSSIAQDPNALRDVILSKYDVKLTPAILKDKYDIDLKGYEIPDDLWNMHALIVVDELVRDDQNNPGHLYAIRANINKDKDRLKDSAETIKEELPSDFDPEYAKNLDISNISEKLAEARKGNEKVNELKTKKENLKREYYELEERIKNAGPAIERHEYAMRFLKDRLEAFQPSNEHPNDNIVVEFYNTTAEKVRGNFSVKIENLRNELQRISDQHTNDQSRKEEVMKEGREIKEKLANLPTYSTEQYEKEIAEYDMQKHYLEQWKSMQSYLNQAQEKQEESDKLTGFINKLRKDVLAGVMESIDAPVTLKNGRLAVKTSKGPVPVQDLSDAQKVIYYLDIITGIEDQFGSIVVEEGRADFDAETKKIFDKKISELEKAGWQIIRAKSSEGDLRVET